MAFKKAWVVVVDCDSVGVYLDKKKATAVVKDEREKMSGFKFDDENVEDLVYAYSIPLKG